MASKRTKRVYRVVYRNTGGNDSATPESEDREGMLRYLASIVVPTPSIADAWVEAREVTEWERITHPPKPPVAEEPADADPGDE